MKKLALRVADKLLADIDSQELAAAKTFRPVPRDLYVSLARLYRSEALYHLEVEILNRFINHPSATASDISYVEKQLGEANKLANEVRADENSAKQQPQVEHHYDDVTTAQTIRASSIINKPLTTNEKPISVAFVCGAYTGKSVNDELYELAIVTADYCRANDVILAITDEYHGYRKPSKHIPEKAKQRFQSKNPLLEQKYFDDHQVASMLGSVTTAISHNDAMVERQHLFCQFPKLTNTAWRSMQDSIQWQALGLDSLALSDLLSSHGLPAVTATPLIRARAMLTLSAQVDQLSQASYLKRIIASKPMAPFIWTPALKSQSKKVAQKRFRLPFVS
ncbi:MAG: hypothetical protein V2I33_02715 [Kangiellaceae bacterium]|nr:hypothetical protein [Kangiellaceae bacterium]